MRKCLAWRRRGLPRVACWPFGRRCPRAQLQAAQIASAHSPASITNTSSKAASRAGLVPGWPASRRARPAATRARCAHRLTPAAPPSMRRKLMALAPCGISGLASGRIEPRLSEGRMKPSPMRPMIAKATSSQQRAVEPQHHHQRERGGQQRQADASPAGRSGAGRPAGRRRRWSAPARCPAGSRMVPTCEADSCSPTCM